MVNLAKEFGAPNVNITENSIVINVLYQSHFDLKFYPRRSKLENPLKVTLDAIQNHSSREYKSIAS